MPDSEILDMVVDGDEVRVRLAAAARALPGYLGEEACENPATGLVSNVCYWSSPEALQAPMSHPAHLQANWLAG